MNEERMKVAAVVVTYNRKELLIENIKMLLAQDYTVDAIIIVDNHSTDGTQTAIEREFAELKTRIKYNYLDKNIGGAGGFEYGTRKAYSMGYDLIWLMDDDGRPMTTSTLGVLIDKIVQLGIENQPFVINSLVTYDNEHLTFSLMGKNDVTALKKEAKDGLLHDTAKPLVNPFNGTLISKELVDEIGYPRGEFFIYGDEREYVTRAVKNRAYVATVMDSLYYHPENANKVRFMGKLIPVLKRAQWRHYYSVRNNIYLNKSDGNIFGCVKFIVAKIIAIMFFEKNKFRSLSYVFRGLNDGLRGRLGITITP